MLTNSSEVHPDGFEKTIQRSFLISADMAHALHPNYWDKHHETHQVGINKGIVLKINVNQKYATDIVSGSLVKIVA